MNVDLFLLSTGGIIFIGFAARLLFEKTQIPDVIILMGCGVLFGHFLPPAGRVMIYRFAPYFGTLVLIMVLFEGGLHIDPGEAVSQLRPALLLSAVSFGVTTLLLTAVAHLAWGWALLPAICLGTVLGCTSSAIVIPVAQHIAMPEATRTLLDLEAAFSDTFAIVALLVLINLAETPATWLASGLRHLVSSFGVAAVLALVVSILWLVVLEYTKRRPLSYLLTFAVLMLLYALVEWLDGSGAIAVLLFGILLTESKRLPKWLFVFGKVARGSGRESAHATLQWFHQELTFLVRTFFFVYLGLLFEAERLSGPLLWAVTVLSGLILVGRVASVFLMSPSLVGQSRWLVSAFVPRGLVSAVLAALPAAHGIPGTERLLDYTVPVIIATSLVMSAVLYGRPKPAAASQP